MTPTLVDVLPRVCRSGRRHLAGVVAGRPPDGYDEYLANQVWLDAAAPPDFVARLAGGGVSVRGRSWRARGRATWPPKARPTLSTCSLSARRRGRVPGRRRRGSDRAGRCPPPAVRDGRDSLPGRRSRRVLGSLILEHGAVTAAAAGLGFAAGPGRRAHRARPSCPNSPTTAAFPVSCSICLAGSAPASPWRVVAAVVAAIAVGGILLVRQASPSRLRDAQQ